MRVGFQLTRTIQTHIVMANNFVDISTPLDSNKDNFPSNSPSSEIANNSPFQGGSIFQEEKEVFPLEMKYGKAIHTAKK